MRWLIRAAPSLSWRRFALSVILCTMVGGAMAQSGGLGWVTDGKTRCRAWLGPVDPSQIVEVDWSGECVGGFADGPGVLFTRHKTGNGRVVGAVLGEERKPLWLQRTVGVAYVKIVPGDPDQSRFEGTLRAGKREGRGVLELSNGYKYDGEWKDGVREGRGIESWNGDLYDKYEGHFHHGRREGSGVYRGPDAYLYEGTWKAGLQDDKGVLYRDGEKYSGQWHAGKPNGEGRFTWLKLESYDGAWRDGRPHGHGTWRNFAVNRGARIIRYSGQWRDGVFSEEGRLFVVDCDGRNCTFGSPR